LYETRSVTEVARNFADYINRVVYRGERFVLVRGNKPVAELGPLPVGKRLAELYQIRLKTHAFRGEPPGAGMTSVGFAVLVHFCGGSAECMRD
jgi:antitoxin (DNA-binding transcriptional repressor) of toxin-antitoxin stability system